MGRWAHSYAQVFKKDTNALLTVQSPYKHSQQCLKSLLTHSRVGTWPLTTVYSPRCNHVGQLSTEHEFRHLNCLMCWCLKSGFLILNWILCAVLMASMVFLFFWWSYTPIESAGVVERPSPLKNRLQKKKSCFGIRYRLSSAPDQWRHSCNQWSFPINLFLTEVLMKCSNYPKTLWLLWLKDAFPRLRNKVAYLRINFK